MDTKKLELLLKAINIGSLKKAADNLDYTPSGLVYAMNALEKEVGFTLLWRSSKGISLTPEGELLKPYLVEITKSVKRFESKAMEIVDKRSVTLHIGSYPGIARNWMPDLIQKFRQECPHVDIHLYVAAGDLSFMLTTGSIDSAIGASNIATKNNFIHLMDKEVFVAIPDSDPLAKSASISLSQLTDRQVLIPSYNPESKGSQELQRWYATLPSPQKLHVSSYDCSVLLALVDKGLGITFVSGIYQPECPEHVCMLPLDPPLVREIVLATAPDKPVSPTLKKFIQAVQQYTTDLC